jgi:HAD superfamily hydrolase (TIGR01509 family)
MKFNTYLFDLDGVLVNTDEIQYITIKTAVKDILNYDISRDTSIDNIFRSTITTIEKLNILSKKIGFNETKINLIYETKKQYADSYFQKLIPDNEKIELVKYLKNNNCKIAVVTNSNKNSANIILKKIGIYEYIDLIISNEDVLNKKPSPEPYLKAIETLDVIKEACIIFEDSDVGITCAKNTGCNYYHVKSSLDVDIGLIKLLNKINNNDGNKQLCIY